jgi:PAS domain S-box-containing protein
MPKFLSEDSGYKEIQHLFAEELVSSDKQLNLLLSVVLNTKDAVLITDAESLDEPFPRIVFVNESFVKMSGYSREEILGRSPRFLQGPETDRIQLDHIRENLQLGIAVEVELINYHKDGSKFWVEINIVPVFDHNQQITHFISIQRDITRRKTNEINSLRQEKKFKYLFQIAEVELELYNTQGVLVEVNPLVLERNQVSSLTEYDSDNLFEQLKLRKIDPDHLRSEGIIRDEWFQEDRIYQITLSEVNELWFSGYLLQKQDITFNRQIQQDLTDSLRNLEELNQKLITREALILANEKKLKYQLEETRKASIAWNISQSRFKELFDNSLVGIWILQKAPDSEDFILVDINKKALKWDKRSKNLLIGNSFHQLFPGIVKGIGHLLANVNPMQANLDIPRTLILLKNEEVWIEGFVFMLDSGELILNLKDVSHEVRSEKVARESFQRLQIAVKAANLGIFEWNIPNNLLIWDDKQYEIFDYPKTKNSLIYQNWFELLIPEDQQRIERIMDQALRKGGTVEYDFRIKVEGRIRHLKCFSEILLDQEGKPGKMVGVNWDITEEVESRQQLQQREEMLRRITENIADVISVTNPEGVITYLSPSFTKLTGFSIESRLGRSVFELVHPEDLERIQNAVMESILKKEPGLEEYRLRMANGSYIWVETKGNLIFDEESSDIGAVYRTTNIHARKIAEINLLQSNKALHDIKTALDVANIVSFTDQNGNFTYVNPQFEKITGYKATEVLGKKPNMLKSGFHNKDFYRELWKTISSGQMWQGQLKNKNKQGKYFWVNITIVPFLDEINKPFQYSAIMNEITDQKLFEEKLNLQNEMLIRANEELDSLVYSASHDLRAPLTSVLGLIELVEKAEISADRSQYLHLMRKSINKLDDTIKQITYQSRNARLEISLQTIQLKEVIEDSLEALSFLNEAAEFDFRIEVDITRPFVSDRTRLEIIFKNLISNALKYRNSRVSRSFLQISAIQLNNGDVGVTFADNGIGIYPEELPKIFNMFHRSTELSSGSGLGLYIVNETLKKLESSISVKSEFGKGTHFDLILHNFSSNFPKIL